MLTATLKCQVCGTSFTVDLDQGDTSCPSCGSSTTFPLSKDTSKKIVP